jgi:HSP20 family protein
VALIKWDPFGSTLFPELAGLERRINHLTRRMMGEGWQEGHADGQLFTPVDVFTRGNDLVVRAELPGIDPQKDVDVSVHNGMLTIRGERRQEQVHEGEQWYRMERSYGSFERTVVLPESVNEADIQARYENGILEVIVPKAAEISSTKKVPVQVGGTGKAETLEAAGQSDKQKPAPQS